MNLQGGLFAMKCGPPAYVHHPIEWSLLRGNDIALSSTPALSNRLALSSKTDRHRIDAIGRHDALLVKRHHIGSREAHLPPQLKTLHHGSAEHVRTHETVGSLLDAPLLQQATHKRRADALPLKRQGRGGHHLDVQCLTVGSIVAERLLAFSAKAVVIAHQQKAHPQVASQHLLHEVAG